MHKGIIEAEQYHQNSELQMSRALEAINRFPWKGTERVLDIGCGDGKISDLLAEKLSQGVVIGYDVSPQMIDFASETFSRPNLFFLEGNAQAIPFRCQFDVVASFCCLHWVPNQTLALEGIYRSLVPGGKTLFVIPARASSNLSPLIEAILKKPHWADFSPNWGTRIIFSSAEEYSALMEKVGFQIQQVVTGDNQIEFQGREGLIGWLRPVVPFILALTPELQRAFLEELADSMSRFCNLTPDGNLLFSSPKFEIVGEKPY